MFQRRQHRDLGLTAAAPEERGQHVESNHDAAIGRRHEGRDLFRDAKRADRNGRGAGHPNAVDGGQKLGHVRQQNADAIPWPHAELHQAVSGATS
jgi:hypothetical protein